MQHPLLPLAPRFLLLLLPPVMLLLTGCAGATPDPVHTNPDPAHNSRLSLDWPGIYRGTLPCADCEGIETTITLAGDGTYLRQLRYLGRESLPRVDEGNLVWDDDGGKITLVPEDGQDAQSEQRYQVGENRLFHLDRQGARIEGALAERYVLVKDLRDSRLEGKEWQLTELLGQSLEVTAGSALPSLYFDGSRGRLAGSDGCNRLMGSYRLREREQIEFGPLAGTLMACPDMALPDAFREMLGRIGNYQIIDGELQLFKGRMAVLARFREVNAE